MECLPQRYLDLLVQCGQVGLAADVLNRIEQTRPDLSETLDVEGLRKAIDAIQAGRMLIHIFVEEPERIHMASQAARILGSPPKGSWELHRSPPMFLPDIELFPEQLAEALRISAESGSEQAVDAVTQPVLWLHARHSEESVCVLLPAFIGGKSESVQIALRLAIRPAGTALTRSILLDPVANECECFGGQAIGLVEQLQDESARRTLLAPINDRIVTTLRRMRSVALASAMNPSGGAA